MFYGTERTHGAHDASAQIGAMGSELKKITRGSRSPTETLGNFPTKFSICSIRKQNALLDAKTFSASLDEYSRFLGLISNTYVNLQYSLVNSLKPHLASSLNVCKYSYYE